MEFWSKYRRDCCSVGNRRKNNRKLWKRFIKRYFNPDQVHEAQLLSLDVTKAKFRLNWTSRWDIDKTIEKTVEWYKKYNNDNVYELC